MERWKVEVREVAGCGASGDDAARFLRELRQLRSGAGLGHAELAARAHYPHDSIRSAEAGPSLPDLPMLAAYVRGCGGTTEEWEERWRSLTRSPALSTLPTRAAGCSAAASAGARVGAVTTLPDGPDPTVILAALDRVAGKMAVAAQAPSRAPLPAGGVAVADAMAASSRLDTAAAAPLATAQTVPAAGTAPVAAIATPTAVPGAVREPGGRLPLPPRALAAALVAMAVCVLVAVLAIFS